MLFSRRNGLGPAQKALQLESVDAELRSALWSCFHELVIKKFVGHDNYPYGMSLALSGSNLESFFTGMWLSYFKLPTDTIPDDINEAVQIVRKHFFEGQWYDVYDFLEFALDSTSDAAETSLRTAWNHMLKRENSGYRLVERRAVKITNEEELAEIEQAATSSTRGAQGHISAALSLLADRKKPDYRNSIKEAISAVEAISRALTGSSKASLGPALNVLQDKVGMHGALKAAFASLYGYTSDEHGIRHAMLEEPTLTFSDAKFMVVACSAFVNYVVGKASETGIKL